MSIHLTTEDRQVWQELKCCESWQNSLTYKGGIMEALLGALPWQLIVAYLVNTVVVVVVANLLKKHWADIKPHLPWLAPLLGMVLPAAAQFLAGVLGHPIDFSPILGLFSGAAAVAMHQPDKS